MARIGIDARLTHYRVGGTSRYIKGIISALPTPPNQTTTILQSRKARSNLTCNFRHAKLWTPPHHPLERMALSAELLRHRLDLLHSPDFIAPLWGAKRHIITVHDLSFIHYPEYITSASRQYYNGQIEASVKRADHILVPSYASKQDLIDILDVSPAAITVHWHGVEENLVPLSPDETMPVIDSLNLPPEYLLFVGTIEPRKNLVGLASAYRELLQEMPDAPKLVIAGRAGWHFEQLMADIAAIGVNASIEFRHDVTDEQLPALYNCAIALITPSYYEGFGLPALEAMACGTLPIVSNVASLPEVTGDVGLKVDPHDATCIADAMKTVLTDSAFCAAQSAAGIERAKLFTWSATAKIVQDSYQALLN